MERSCSWLFSVVILARVCLVSGMTQFESHALHTWPSMSFGFCTRGHSRLSFGRNKMGFRECWSNFDHLRDSAAPKMVVSTVLPNSVFWQVLPSTMESHWYWLTPFGLNDFVGLPICHPIHFNHSDLPWGPSRYAIRGIACAWARRSWSAAQVRAQYWSGNGTAWNAMLSLYSHARRGRFNHQLLQLPHHFVCGYALLLRSSCILFGRENYFARGEVLVCSGLL